eukprot:Rhum_TRINITY_DN14308_c4_g1::Rhum_TRINITY_DN14308_c4_g1_i1::g.80771::m.80771
MTEEPLQEVRTFVEQAGMAEAAPSDSHHAAGRGGAEASAAAPPAAAPAAAAPPPLLGEDAVFAAASDPVIPEDVIRLYASIPAKVQAVINQAGIEAKERGETMEVRVSELEWLTHLTPDDVYYAALLLGRGESACVIVKDLLTRAEHLAMKGPPPTPAPVVPYVTQVRTHSPSRHPSTSPLRKPTQSVGSPTRLATRLVSPAVCTVTEPYDPSRTRPKRRSFTPKHPTRAYNMAAMEYQQIRELSKDSTLPGPDAVRAGIHVRSAARTASPPPVMRSEAIARADPNTIVGKLLKSPNAGASLRSRSSRMTLPREPATQAQYASQGMCDVLASKRSGSRSAAAFGTSSGGRGNAHLPHEVQAHLQSQKKQQRKSRLTAAATQDAATLLQGLKGINKRKLAAGSSTPRTGGFSTPRTGNSTPRPGGAK